MSLREVDEQLQNEGEVLPIDQLRLIFNQMDASGDGLVTKGEMYDFSY